MSIEVKNSVKPVDYTKSMQILEQRVQNVLSGKKDEFLWIIEHSQVYTAGTSSTNADLLDKSLRVIKTNRWARGVRGGTYRNFSRKSRISGTTLIYLYKMYCSFFY